MAADAYEIKAYISRMADYFIRKGLLAAKNYGELSTKDITVFGAVYGCDGRLAEHGRMFLWLEYQKKFFRLVWTIRNSGNTDPACSNRPTDIAQLVTRIEYGENFVTLEDTHFGFEAFQKDTPDKYLEPDDLALRLLFKNIRHYVAENRLCAKCRRAE